MNTEREPGFTPLPRGLGFRAGVLLALTVVVALAFLLYVLYARGLFEDTQRLTLIAQNAEGVTVGMDMTFSGFPVGRVRRIALGEDGLARIEIDVPRRDARWLRASSVFTLEVPVVGAARIRAYSANLQDPPLPDGAERRVLRGDTAEEIPQMVATLRGVLENLSQITASGSSLQESLAHARAVTERMAGRYGALGAVLGSEDHAKKVLAAIDRANALLGSMGRIALKLDRVLSKADERLFGAGGVADETQRAVAQANAILVEVRERLTTVDAILANAQAASANAKAATGNVAAATADLAALRAEVEASLRKVAHLIEELNRKWPFERKTEIRLP